MTTSNRSSLVDLLNQARGGDAQARDRLFAKCRNYLVVVARAEAGSWLRAKVDPSDIVQQTLLDAHRGLGDFRGSTEAEWLGWLRRILSHNAADYVRHYIGTEKRDAGREVAWGHAGSEPRLGVAPEPAAPDATPSQLMARREPRTPGGRRDSQLPDDYREVIVLRNLERLPFDEVAQRMGRSRPAVQMLWLRAIRTVQDSMPDAEAS